jgi:hypothetical protein
VSGFAGKPVTDNLIYANANQGILVQNAFQQQIAGNTIYQPVGDGVRVQNSAQGVILRNNILQVNSGYGIYVVPESQTGFSSDYDLLFNLADPNAHVGFWNNANQTTLANWQAANAQDAHSFFGDPRFVDINGADNVFGFQTTPTVIDGGGDDNF